MDLDRVARHFGLGQPTSRPVVLAGLSGAAVHRLTTGRGRFVVKVRATPPDPRSSIVESLARTAGVRTPAALLAPGSTDPWVALEGAYVRVFEFVDGTPPAVPLGAAEAAWLGGCVARIAAVAPTGPVPPLSPDGLPAPLRAVGTDLAALVGSVATTGVLLHRDIKRDNILTTVDGPVLLDFDHVRPEVPWYDLVHHAFFLACDDLGPQEPDAGCVRSAIAGYLDAGGAPGAADPSAFAGLLRGLFDWVTAPPLTPNAGAATIAHAAKVLPIIRDAIPRWSALLRP